MKLLYDKNSRCNDKQVLCCAKVSKIYTGEMHRIAGRNETKESRQKDNEVDSDVEIHS